MAIISAKILAIFSSYLVLRDKREDTEARGIVSFDLSRGSKEEGETVDLVVALKVDIST